MHDWTWTHNDLVPKRTLNHSVKLAKQTLNHVAKLAETSDIAPVLGNYKNAYVKRVRDTPSWDLIWNNKSYVLEEFNRKWAL